MCGYKSDHVCIEPVQYSNVYLFQLTSAFFRLRITQYNHSYYKSQVIESTYLVHLLDSQRFLLSKANFVFTKKKQLVTHISTT